MDLDFNIPRCGGKWDAKGSNYVADECKDCVRFQQRFNKTFKTPMMSPPDTVVCESKISWTRPWVFVEE